MLPPTIRTMAPNDQPAVRALVLAGLAEHWGDVDPALNGDLDDLARFHPGSITVVAELNGRIVGTGTLAPRGPDVAELVRISVAPDQRRSRLARTIVDQLVERAWADGHDRVICETTSAWTDVVAFWLSCGFVVTHTAESPFGEDTWFERRRPQPS